MLKDSQSQFLSLTFPQVSVETYVGRSAEVGVRQALLGAVGEVRQLAALINSQQVVSDIILRRHFYIKQTSKIFKLWHQGFLQHRADICASHLMQLPLTSNYVTRFFLVAYLIHFLCGFIWHVFSSLRQRL